jgi:hypothetical protein
MFEKEGEDHFLDAFPEIFCGPRPFFLTNERAREK